MKKILVIGLIILLAGIVSAQGTAFRISTNQNAHAQLENYAPLPHYGYNVYLDEYTGLITGSYNALFLSSDTNAHISTTQDSTYSHPINFGEKYRNCVPTPVAGQSCPLNHECVLSLGGTRTPKDVINAHGAQCDTSSYYNFCCEIDFCGNGEINDGETCSNCPEDVGACPNCGDGTCDADECSAGCLDCGVSDCCVATGGQDPACNVANGENCNNCGDCSCSGSTPYCVSGSCVECGNAGHCTEYNIGDRTDDYCCDCSGDPLVCTWASPGTGDYSCYEEIMTVECGPPNAGDYECYYGVTIHATPCNGEGCSGEGLCNVCTPDCSGKQCGDDGCGGSCGECNTGETCEDGFCVPEGCTPDCTGVPEGDCADDGCEGVCNNCNEFPNSYCNTVLWDCKCMQFTCEEIGKECDDKWNNGCGETLDCGSCPIGQGCDNGQCVDITGQHWANLIGDPISSAQVGDTVKLVWPSGNDYNFEINEYNTESSVDDVTGENVEGDAVATWTITNEAMSLADENEDEAIFEFEVGGSMSNHLHVDKNSYQDDPPNITINTPKNRECYYNTDNLGFSYEVTDTDDELEYLWDFGDGTTSSSENPTNTYTGQTGQKIINLNVTETTRDKTFIGRVSIVIMDPDTAGRYTFAYINEPEWGEVKFGKEIKFNASESFVIETSSCSGTCNNIDCVGGECPANTKETGRQAISNAPLQDYSKLTFSWLFDNGDEGNYTRTGNAGKHFNKLFANIGKHKADLNVEYSIS